MKWRPYPRYKASGVEWLGEVPGHWMVLPVKRLLEYVTSGARDWGGRYSDHGSVFLRIGNLTREGVDLDLSDLQFVTAPQGADTRRMRVKAGDVVVSITADLGSVAWIPKQVEGGYVSQHLALCRRRSAVDSRWLAYAMRSDSGRTQLLLSGYGGTKIQLSLGDVREPLVALPTILEQNSIVTFLDRETAKIDILIAKQELLIELAQEKRHALISQAVTKGLNPLAPMKPSGVEWLGDVPAHWGLEKFGHIAVTVRGASPRPAGDERYFNGDFMPWITVGEVTGDTSMYLTSTETMLTREGAELSRMIPNGTLVLTNSGATLGVPKILSISGCANDGILAFLSLRRGAVKQFLYYYLCSLTENLRDRMKQGSGQPNLNTDIVKALVVPWPPECEQDAISAT